MHFPSVEKPQQLEKPQGLWVGGSSLQTPPCPLGVSVCVHWLYVPGSAVVLGCHVSGVTSHSMMCVSLCWCRPLCVCVSVQDQPLPERGEKCRSTPPPHPPESVSLILAASAAKNKFPQGRLGLRPGRPQITFEVT